MVDYVQTTHVNTRPGNCTIFGDNFQTSGRVVRGGVKVVLGHL